jgi:hypothetical protein
MLQIGDPRQILSVNSLFENGRKGQRRSAQNTKKRVRLTEGPYVTNDSEIARTNTQQMFQTTTILEIEQE